MKISTTIDKLSLDSTLNVTSLATEGTLYKPSASNTVATIPYGVGILASTSPTATPSYISTANTNAFKILNTVNHIVNTTSTYNITVPSADTYPIITFEILVQKFVSAGAAYPQIRFNGDSGSNYNRYIIHNNGGSSLTSLLDTQTGIHIAEVNSEVVSNVSNTGFSTGTMYLKSGTMRSLMMESQQAQSGNMGYVMHDVKWTDTASVITEINLILPDNGHCYCKFYQIG